MEEAAEVQMRNERAGAATSIGAQSCKEMLGEGDRAYCHTPRTLSQESLIPLVECYLQGHEPALSGLSPGQRPLSRVVAVEFLCQGTELFL